MGGFDPSFVDRSSVKYKAIPRDYCFEDIAARSYFLGPCFKDVFSIIREALAEIIMIFLNSDAEITGTAVCCFYSIVVSAGGHGRSWNSFHSCYFCNSSFGFPGDRACRAFGFRYCSFLEICLPSRRISYRCPMCKEEYNIAIYKCPCCGIPHSRLRPGAYGIFRRNASAARCFRLRPGGKAILIRLQPLLA